MQVRRDAEPSRPNPPAPDNDAFMTSERAKAVPLEVRWEASEDRVQGLFVGVTHWFPITKIRG